MIARIDNPGIAQPKFEEITGAAVVTFRVLVGETAGVSVGLEGRGEGRVEGRVKGRVSRRSFEPACWLPFGSSRCPRPRLPRPSARRLTVDPRRRTRGVGPGLVAQSGEHPMFAPAITAVVGGPLAGARSEVSRRCPSPQMSPRHKWTPVDSRGIQETRARQRHPGSKPVSQRNHAAATGYGFLATRVRFPPPPNAYCLNPLDLTFERFFLGLLRNR